MSAVHDEARLAAPHRHRMLDRTTAAAAALTSCREPTTPRADPLGVQPVSD